RAFNKGTIGMLNVTGEEDSLIYSHKQRDEIYLGLDNKDVKSNLTVNPSVSNQTSSAGASNDLKALGKSVYSTTCQACHQANGEGIAGVFPPLAKSDFLNNNKDAVIHAVVKGLSGPITVNGKNYNGVMPPQTLTDDQIAAVLTYVYSSWGNSGKTVTKEEVSKVRGGSTASR